MRKICKQNLNWISEHPMKFSISVSLILLSLYVFFALRYRLGVNMDAGTAISVDIALITIIITSIGLSISGYIFLNGYFGTVIEGDRSLSRIIEGLNKTYICKIIGASSASMLFIGCAFIVIFNIKDANEASLSAFISPWECAFQHLTYVGSIGSILYNFHFLCHIINPDQLIKQRAFKVVNAQMKIIINEYERLPSKYTDAGWEWEQCKEFSIKNDSTRLYAIEESSLDRVQQTLGIIKYIYEIESIITKVIELNAIQGENRSEVEALKFIFADRHIGTMKYKRRIHISGMEGAPCFYLGKGDRLQKYEFAMAELIEQYVVYYDQLILLKNALIKMGKEKIKDLEIKEEVNYFVAMMMRVTLKLFSNFVKMTELNIGGGYFTHAYLSWSDLSGSNLTGSDFSSAYMVSAILLGADLSNSKLDEVYICDSDLTNVNLGYASLIGADCTCINLTKAKLTDVIFHSSDIIQQHEIIKERILDIFKNDNIDLARLEECSTVVVKNGEKIEKITNLTAATLDNVVLKSVDLSALKLRGASFENSVLTGSLWLHTIDAVGVKMRNANFRNILAVQSDFSMSDFQASNLGEALFVDVNMSQTNFINVNGVSMKVYGSSEKILMYKDEQEVFIPYSDSQFARKDFRINQIKDAKGCSKWIQINFQNMNAVESQWHNTLLNESDFTGAILKNAILKNIAANWVNMERCDMTYSMVSDVSFKMAKMSSCVFTRAWLKNISFENANLCKSNFIHAYIENTDFVQCNLNDSIFSHAVIKNCRFIDCGLHRIYLQSTEFKNVMFDSSSFLNILRSYNGDGRIRFESCSVKISNNRKYKEIYEKIKGYRTISIRQKGRGNMVLINTK